MDPAKLSPSARQVFRLIEFDEDEQLLYEIRKHPFGLFLIYLVGTFVTFMMLMIAILAAAFLQGDPLETGFDAGGLRSIVIVLGIFLAFLSLIGTAIGAYLYRSNVVLITTDKISQLLNRTIFDRKISQLSIGDVQDVTVHQRGLFPHILHYGTLVLETAGEQQNYTFTFTPDPYTAAQAIVNAHEENLKQYGN